MTKFQEEAATVRGQPLLLLLFKLMLICLVECWEELLIHFLHKESSLPHLSDLPKFSVTAVMVTLEVNTRTDEAHLSCGSESWLGTPRLKRCSPVEKGMVARDTHTRGHPNKNVYVCSSWRSGLPKRLKHHQTEKQRAIQEWRRCCNRWLPIW